MNDPVVLQALTDHLSVRDLFRLHIALGRAPAWPLETSAAVATRMELRTFRPEVHSMSHLGRRIHDTKRCHNCGRRIRRKTLDVCETCTSDPEGPFSLMSRADVHADVFPTWSPSRVASFCRRWLVPVYMSRTGAHFYWRREVLAQASQINTR